MRTLAVLMLLLLVAPVAAQQPSHAEVVRSAVNEFIRPAFNQLVEETVSLEMNVAALCEAKDPALIELAQNQFRSAVTAYSWLESLRFGPLAEDNRAERLLFWPDRKGIALKQVQAILAEQDETALDPMKLRGKSVAVQGFLALEFALFGTGYEEIATEEGAFRCAYAHAVATAIGGVADELADAWNDADGVAGRLMAPDPANADFRTDNEALEALLGAMTHGVEAIRDTRILPFLGRDGAAPRPKSGLFWRSGMTMPSIAANFAGLRELFVLSGIGSAGNADSQWLDNSIGFEFGNADRALAMISGPLEETLADERQLKALSYLVIVTQSLDTMLGENLSAGLGLSIGFSSLDGD